MKKFGLLGTACLLVLSATAAQANTVFTDFYAPNGTSGLLLCAQGQVPGCPQATPDSDSWTFDITDSGFIPGTQTITSASIDLELKDDPNDPNAQQFRLEFAQLTTGGTTSDVFQVVGGTTTLEVLSLVTLNLNGTLDVILTATQGDFLFIDATLNADHAVVPVPAAIWLFGSGLLGLVGMARRRRT